MFEGIVDILVYSFPEMIILRKVLRVKLIAIFAGILALAITFTGYLFNLIS